MKHSNLFSPIKFGTLTLKNKLVRSATHEALADDDGHLTEEYFKCIRRLAEGGVGLIVTGLMYPESKGKLYKAMSVENEGCIPELSKIADTVHGVNNDCRIAIQIGHTGPQYSLKYPERVRYAPSPVVEEYTNIMPQALTLPEIESFIDACAASIGYAQKANIDAVQVHAAHGWLISSFLSPHTNHRTDIYGGSTENRTRLLTEIIKRAHSITGKDYPVFVKMNACDFLLDGIEVPEALEMGKIIEDAGYVAMEVTSAMWATINRKSEDIGWEAELIPEARVHIKTVNDEAYHREFTRIFKQNFTKAKIILIGGLRTPSLMEDILQSGDADLVSISRPLIIEPEIPNLWFEGSEQKSACISCNMCVHERDEKFRCPHILAKGK